MYTRQKLMLSFVIALSTMSISNSYAYYITSDDGKEFWGNCDNA